MSSLKLNWLKKLFPVFLVLVHSIVFAQTGKKTFGVIIEYPNQNIRELQSKLQTDSRFSIDIKPLGTQTNTYLLTGMSDSVIYSVCLQHPDISALEYNDELEQRAKPNDTRINEQYYLSLIKAYESWDITSGGSDYSDREIVIGIIDDGYDITHEDITDNIYSNPDEIPGDGKDNDNNGFIDDINGWNTRTKNAIHDVKSHGTNILGVLGAKGNNQRGIAGINWNVKLLPVTTGNLVSNVIEGYDYLLSEKKQFISSGGKKGSNIVVASYSGGLSKAFAKDHPIWCGMYEKLGAEGILSVAATTNENDNVEIVGDMPSTCTSPFLVIVNSSNKSDELDVVTGFGSVSVDLSAPGDRILTTDLINKGTYKVESGTSLATPIVAGAAALIYSVKCSAFHSLVTDDPSGAALAVKDALLKSVDAKPSMTGKTVTGGRLNIFKSINHLINNYCDLELAPKGKLKINTAAYSNGMITIDYISENTNELTLIIFDQLGREILKTKIIPPLFGSKIAVIQTNTDLQGAFYFASLLSSTDIASKGFNVVDPRK